MPNSRNAARRLELVRGTIARQKQYIARVPDPDNRSRAESNLQTLVQMRTELEETVRTTPSAG